jgi:hypothetical protein
LSLLRQAGFKIDDVSSLVVDRHLTPPHRSVREEILAQPFEQALRASGDATIDVIVGDVIVALEPYRSDGAITVPSEVYLFQARNDIAAHAAQH